MSTGFRDSAMPARRRSRRRKLNIEPLFQYRDRDTTFRREGTIRPAAHLLGRVTEEISGISNPAYLQITPAFINGVRLDIKRGDLFIRLKFLQGTATTDAAAIAHATGSRAKFSLEAHHFEILTNMYRILGDLS